MRTFCLRVLFYSPHCLSRLFDAFRLGVYALPFTAFAVILYTVPDNNNNSLRRARVIQVCAFLALYFRAPYVRFSSLPPVLKLPTIPCQLDGQTRCCFPTAFGRAGWGARFISLFCRRRAFRAHLCCVCRKTPNTHSQTLCAA